MPKESGIKECEYSRWWINKQRICLVPLDRLHFIQFQEERVNFNAILSTGAQDLIQLVVSTTGNTVRLACRRMAYINIPIISSSSSNNVIVHDSSGSGLSAILRGPYLPQQMLHRSPNAQVQEERSALFTLRNSRKRWYNSAATASGDVEGSSAKRKPGTKNWTVVLMYLADNHATRTLHCNFA